ncbi:hypothetical protein ACFWH4_01215 [Streptomyces sp. NPDC127091]|uniref:hypothetical protein n=1 Tax=Streptomyces sp. NPDC127091 TaxID=3347134 RepID=UPI00365210A4
MGLFSKNETGKPCQACGHATTPGDKAVKTSSGARVHESHTTNPSSGLYGDRKRGLFGR